jgi:tetratricopeptide (TPR) repeat protein
MSSGRGCTVTAWQPFPHDAAPFRYEKNALKDAWDGLHVGDREPWPDEERLQAVLENNPSAAPDNFDGDVAALAAELQAAWRAFHAGDFGEAIERGTALGPLGHAPANKAAGIYAHHLETSEKTRQKLYLAAAERAEAAAAVLPDDANTWYFHAFNLGRYSQSISVVKALRKGIGGKIQTSLEKALALEPDHAEAHTALGLYHAEIVDKVGKMIGSMTYGASADKAVAHFERSVELVPDSPIARIEFGNGLYMLFGDKLIDRVTELYEQATEMTPKDAMEKLDIESALAELE